MELKDEERSQLLITFNCEEEKLDERIQKYAAAAEEEYMKMILGQRVFTRGQDINQYRLYLLIKHVFDGALPSEQQISSHFQTTSTQSRSLLRAVMSKYRYQLQKELDESINIVLAVAKQKGRKGPYFATIDSANLVDALNRRIADIDGTLPQVTRQPRTAASYEIPRSVYMKLKK